MRRIDRRTATDGVKLLVFVLVTSLATGLLAVLIGNLSFGPTREYHAVFSDATGVVGGDDVRIAGVKVGTVRDVGVVHRTDALVTFTVDADHALSRSTLAAIRYRNLVGQRYLALSQGSGPAGVLPAGATIPLRRTTPALDLTVLFDGFKPLFAALSPRDVNRLSYEIVRVLQGEGGTLDSLLAHTASVTSTIADRDHLVGSVIDHLDQVMTTVARRDGRLSALVVELRRLMSGLAGDRSAILGSLDSVSHLAVETSQLVSGARPPLAADVHHLRRVAGVLDRNRGEIDRTLKVLPVKLDKIGATATYGSWFNFYLCDFTGEVRLPGGAQLPLSYDVGSARCDL